MRDEDKKFYKYDKKEYIVKKNRDFNSFYRKYDDGFRNAISLDEIQDLIDKIVIWYEIKYPEFEIYTIEGIRYSEFKDIPNLTKKLDFSQFIPRVSCKQRHLLRCSYRGNCYVGDCLGRSMTCIDIRSTSPSEMVGMHNTLFSINVDLYTGKILNLSDLREHVYFLEGDLSLSELLMIFDTKYKGEYDYSSLVRCLYYYNTDVELRNFVFNLAALKLLYSKNTTPSHGYFRALKLIDEYNATFKGNISSEKIEEIMNNFYPKDKDDYSHKLARR